MRVTVRRPGELQQQEVEQWEDLHRRQPAPANPFCSPAWVLTWYRHFVPLPERQLLLTVHDDEELVGVAPFFLDDVRVSRVRLGTRLQLAGAGQGGSLMELPQVLTAPGRSRDVMRDVVGWVRTGLPHSSTSWVEITVAASQGWFEPQWIEGADDVEAFFRPQRARACVVMPLGDTWPETLSTLKRNVKESLRRSRNRLAKHPEEHRVRRLTDQIDVEAVNRFLDLHRSRSALQRESLHHDAFADPSRRAFLRELLPELGRTGGAEIWELHLGGRQVAAQLVLHGPGTVYVHSSGVDADAWELGPVTHLQEHAFKAACESGDRWVNFSPGPNLAKLRWSEQVHVDHDFALGFGPPSLLGRYTLFAAGQAVSEVQQSRRTARPR